MPKHIFRPKRLKLSKIFNLKPITTVGIAIVFLVLTFLPVFPKPALADWECGDPWNFEYRGGSVTYGTVAHNGECWLARNLGASTDNPTAYNDEDGYGDLFQWGRCDDEHQDRFSTIYGGGGPVSTPACNGDNAWDGEFVTNSGGTYDWIDPQKDTLWNLPDYTNNPCPSGWRVPIKEEWEAELASWDETTDRRVDAFNSPLKLTAGGNRNVNNGSLVNVGGGGYYWSSTVDDTNAPYLYFFSHTASMNSYLRAFGFSVRCIYDSELGEGNGEAVPEFTTLTLIIAAVCGFGIYFVIRRTKKKTTK